jgi:hypothetical protein
LFVAELVREVRARGASSDARVTRYEIDKGTALHQARTLAELDERIGRAVRRSKL